MPITNIVIGLLFGDEGKGITTDFLCEKDNFRNKIVIRFSGGQQAGHNVRIGDITHIHSNFGSGTLRGVPSYFSEHTVIYPVTIYREQKVLESKGVKPKLYIHPSANVSTPYDIAYNRIMEAKNRHGSCGMGIGATMVRSENTGYQLKAIDLTNINVFKAKLNNIQRYYSSKLSFNDRLEFVKYVDEEMKFFFNAIDKLDFSVKNYNFLNQFSELIFEGSQGILLDMDHGFFPNVTYANTTSKNALEICEKLSIPKNQIEIHYVSRCYQTRHGNGWMSNEEGVELINNKDEINVHNEWQLGLRLGEIDYDLINYAINIDSIYSEGIKKALVMTCLDQRPGFKVDYSKIIYENRYSFDKIYESYSSDSKDFNRKYHY